jgi:hypothetical protein
MAPRGAVAHQERTPLSVAVTGRCHPRVMPRGLGPRNDIARIDRVDPSVGERQAREAAVEPWQLRTNTTCPGIVGLTAAPAVCDAAGRRSGFAE